MQIKAERGQNDSVADEGFDGERAYDTERLVTAFKKLIIEMDLRIQDQTQFQDYLYTLCSLIDLKDKDEEKMIEIAKDVLDIAKYIVSRRLEKYQEQRMRGEDLQLEDESRGEQDTVKKHCKWLL